MNFKEIISYLGTKKFWVELIIMTLGMIINSTQNFFVPK